MNKRTPALLSLFLSLAFATESHAEPTTRPALEGAPDVTSISEVLLGAGEGQIVRLEGLDLAALPEIPYELLILPGSQFVFSDDPEYIRVPEGAAIRENVEPGRIRLYVYNVNGIREPEQMDRKIVPVMKNLGNGPLHMRMLAFSSQPPSGNYYRVGKRGLYDYLSSQPSDEIVTVAPGEVVVIDSAFDEAVVRYNDLVHGFYEFVIDQPAEISVLQTAPEVSIQEAYNRIEGVLPTRAHSGAGRGVFGVTDYAVLAGGDGSFVLDPADGPQQLIVADGNRDPWVKGRSQGVDGVTTNQGNYGLLYHIELKRRSSEGKGHALVMWNYRHGQQWCDAMATAIRVNGEVIEVPSDALAVYNPPDAVMVKLFPPLPEGETETISITYSPPGASCLPTPLIFVPVEFGVE